MSEHNCVFQIDQKLKEHNLSLDLSFNFETGGVMFPIPTYWIDNAKIPRGKKHSPPPVFASYCPFCGVKIEKGKQ